MGRSKRASASHGGAQGAAASAPSMATGTQFSTAGHIDTGKRRASRNGAVVFAIVVFAVAFGLVLAATQVLLGGIGLGALVAAAIVGWLASSSVHIVLEWEKAVVLRLGKLDRVSGPGLFWTWPVIEQNTMRVDTRVRVTTFGAEETLTADLVPLDVNAVLFWHVWDAAAACTEVGDFTRAVELAAQTALRDAIGRAGAAEVAIRREQLDRELKRVLEEKVAAWGVTILSVEVRDILLPKELQDVMSLEAQAEQRKKARIILMEAEHDIYEILGEMEELIGDHEAVARLRTMHLLNESLREGKGTVVIPSAFAEGFNEGVGDLFKG